MRRRWVRQRPGRRENLLAALAGVGVGGAIAAVVFYLGRLLLAREPVRGEGGLEVTERGERPLPREEDRA